MYLQFTVLMSTKSKSRMIRIELQWVSGVGSDCFVNCGTIISKCKLQVEAVNFIEARMVQTFLHILARATNLITVWMAKQFFMKCDLAKY